MARDEITRREGEGELVVEERTQLKRPNLYGVVLLNDDYTPMEFVVDLIRIVFHKSEEESTRLMLDVHNKGKGLCGVYTYDVARTKMMQVLAHAEQAEHPLQCVLEVVEVET